MGCTTLRAQSTAIFAPPVMTRMGSRLNATVFSDRVERRGLRPPARHCRGLGMSKDDSRCPRFASASASLSHPQNASPEYVVIRQAGTRLLQLLRSHRHRDSSEQQIGGKTKERVAIKLGHGEHVIRLTGSLRSRLAPIMHLGVCGVVRSRMDQLLEPTEETVGRNAAAASFRCHVRTDCVVSRT